MLARKKNKKADNIFCHTLWRGGGGTNNVEWIEQKIFRVGFYVYGAKSVLSLKDTLLEEGILILKEFKWQQGAWSQLLMSIHLVILIKEYSIGWVEWKYVCRVVASIVLWRRPRWVKSQTTCGALAVTLSSRKSCALIINYSFWPSGKRSIQQRKARRNIKPWCILGDFNSEEVRRCKGKDDLEQVNEIVCALINLLRKWNWKMFLRWVEDSHGVNLTTNQKVDWLDFSD